MKRYFVTFRWVATDEVEGGKKDSTGNGFFSIRGGLTEESILEMGTSIKSTLTKEYEGKMKDISVVILFMKELEE